MKKYLKVEVRLKNGDYFNNPLKLSEVALINQLLKQPNTKSIEVHLIECEKECYNQIFAS